MRFMVLTMRGSSGIFIRSYQINLIRCVPLGLVLQGAGAQGVQALVEERGLVQISDPAALQAIVDAVLAASPKQLEQYRGGKTKLQGYFVGCAAESRALDPEYSFKYSMTDHAATPSIERSLLE